MCEVCIAALSSCITQHHHSCVVPRSCVQGVVATLVTTTLYILYTLYSLNCGQVPTSQYNPGVTVKPAFSSGCMTRIV